MKRPRSLWLLLLSLLFLSFGGLYGGIAMLADPTGGMLDMAAVLPLLPVPSYTLPGLFLITVMGLLPLLLAYALLTRRARRAWMGTLLLGLVLVLWLAVQGLLIGFQWPIQYVTAGNAAVIILLLLMPGVRRFCAE